MPALVSNARNFLKNSDYPFDKVIFRASGSLAVSGYPGNNSVAIPHGLTFAPLPVVQWSTVPDLSVVYESGSGPLPDDVYRANFGISTSVSSDSTNINFGVTNFLNAAQTIYYRVFGLMPSDVNEPVTATSDEGDDYISNTGYNYTKLFSSGKLTLASVTTADHGLGYAPQVFMWTETGGVITPVQEATNLSYASGSKGFQVTSSQIKFLTTSATFGHYRIYLDE